MPAEAPIAAAIAAGNLSERPLARLFYFLDKKKLTGRLEIDAPGGTVTVFVRDGWPCAALAAGAVDDLGQILVESGALSTEAFHESLMRGSQTKRPQVEILREMAAADEATLRRGIETQLRRRILRLFTLDDAPFRLYAGEHAQVAGTGAASTLRLDPFWLIMQGTKGGFGEDRLERDLKRLADQELRVTERFAGCSARFGMTPEEMGAAHLLAGRFHSLEEFEARSDLGPVASRMLLYALWVTELLEAAPPGQRPERRAATPITGPARPEAASPEAKAFTKRVADKIRGLDAQSHFDVLEIPQGAGKDEVRGAYLAMARAFHPDRLAATGLDILRPDVERIFHRVSEAHRVLGDDTQRKEYVETLMLGADAKAKADGAHRVLEGEVEFQKGLVFLRRQDFGMAEEHFRRAADLNADEGEHFALLAWAMFCNPRRDRARTLGEVKETMVRACELAPKSARCFHYLGQVLAAEGDENQALSAYRTAFANNPNFMDAAREIRVIEMRREKQPRPKGGGGLFDRFRKK